MPTNPPYPSDAPLPTVVIDSVKGQFLSSDTSGYPIRLDVKGHISNYADIQKRFGESSYAIMFDSLMVNDSSVIGQVPFMNGHTYLSWMGIPTSFFGKTVILSTIRITMWDVTGATLTSYDVFPPLQFCTVSIPSSLTAEWTDLQFTQPNPPIPEMSWIIIPLAILGIGALAYWYLKRRK